MALYVGSSGFSYPSWRPGFYPQGTRPKEFLRFYAERLPSVELNTSFYDLPSEQQFETWAADTPPDFRFAVKLSRQITHFGRLDLVSTFCERVRVLGERLGPILVQLPPSRPRDEGMLTLLRDLLDPELEYVFELRHESWAGVEVPVLLNSPDADAGFRYFRFREPPYDDPALAEIAARLRPLLAAGLDVYAYFKHEDEPTAPAYAQRLAELVKEGSTSVDK
jgi:uncharacterized protein YecE (DUF72 family)